MNNRRLPALLVSLALLLSLAAPTALSAEETQHVIRITSIEDLSALSKNCTLDSWSKDKIVLLERDLNLEGIEFTPIPTFGGTFSGQGHTISGLYITAAGSTVGLFRHLQSGGVISGLKVEGTVSPAGTRSTVGGIVGDNAGQIEYCTFRGTIRGKSTVGGIAGRSTESGRLVACTACGEISGTSATGGIVGRNLGSVLFCENSAAVNPTAGETSAEPAIADTGSVIAERIDADNSASRLLSSCTDTGGIAGYSSGEILNSANRGAVGYPHVGYNTGGIAGRSRGYIAQCENYGAILGRKDVGGIVGQAEPCVLIDPGRDVVEELRRELTTLEGLIDRALTDASRTGDDISGRLTLMGDYAGDAKDSSKSMLNHLTDFTDENLDSVNTLLTNAADALNRLSPALDDLSEAGRRLERLSRQLGDALDDLEDASDIAADILRQLRDALGGLQQAGSRLTRSAGALGDAAKTLVLSTVSYDAHTAGQTELKSALEDLVGAFSDAADAAGDMRQALTEAEDLPQGDQLLPALGDAEQALDDIAGAVDDIPAPPDLTLPDIQGGQLDELLERLTQAGEKLEAALAAIQKALAPADDLSGKLKDALQSLQSASSSGAVIGRLIRSAFDAAGGAVDCLTRDGVISFTPLGEEFQAASDGLYAAMGSLLEEMEGLNGALQEGNHTLTADLKAVNRQCQVVFDIFLSAADDLEEDMEQGIDAVISDTSEEDIAATREGKLFACANSGSVEGDRNVGGAAGAVGIELEIDPEDDTADRFSFGSTYETKAVLQDCLNYAAVTAKKDCAGGLAGRMDLGTAIACQGYGPVESTDGDCTGGIAGYADASLRNCFAKCTLSGKNCVGGIAGWASRVYSCYAIATISQGAEYLGAIAGDAEESGVLRDNYFVDTDLGGVDGVSYTGQAEPIPFETLEALPDIPLAFLSFSLTLLSEGETVAQIPLLYGKNPAVPQLPPVPEVDGCYGVWPEFDADHIRSDLILEAVYTPYITVIQSLECSGKLSLALAEGQFTDKARLHVTDSAAAPPSGREDCAVYDVSLTGTDLDEGDTVPLRLLNPAGKSAVLWQYRDGTWQKVDAEENGHYLLLSMEGTEGTFCIQPKAITLWPLLTAGVCAAGLTALLIVRSRKKSKKQPVSSSVK